MSQPDSKNKKKLRLQLTVLLLILHCFYCILLLHFYAFPRDWEMMISYTWISFACCGYPSFWKFVSLDNAKRNTRYMQESRNAKTLRMTQIGSFQADRKSLGRQRRRESGILEIVDGIDSLNFWTNAEYFMCLASHLCTCNRESYHYRQTFALAQSYLKTFESQLMEFHGQLFLTFSLIAVSMRNCGWTVSRTRWRKPFAKTMKPISNRIPSSSTR